MQHANLFFRRHKSKWGENTEAIIIQHCVRHQWERNFSLSLPLSLATGEKKTFALKKTARESDQCSLNFHFSCVNLHVFIVELFNNFAPCKFALLMLGLIRTKKADNAVMRGCSPKRTMRKT